MAVASPKHFQLVNDVVPQLMAARVLLSIWQENSKHSQGKKAQDLCHLGFSSIHAHVVSTTTTIIGFGRAAASIVRYSSGADI